MTAHFSWWRLFVACVVVGVVGCGDDRTCIGWSGDQCIDGCAVWREYPVNESGSFCEGRIVCTCTDGVRVEFVFDPKPIPTDGGGCYQSGDAARSAAEGKEGGGER